MQHTVLIDWIDGSTEDTSEFVIAAENERDAILFAIADWNQSTKQWPHCRITRVWVEDPSWPSVSENLKVFPQVDNPSKRWAKK